MFINSFKRHDLILAARRSLPRSLGALVALWGYQSIAAHPLPWIQLSLTAAGLLAGWSVLVKGLTPCLLLTRPTRESLPAIAVSGTFLFSLLLMMLDAAGRLPEAFASASGAHLFFDVTLIALVTSQVRPSQRSPEQLRTTPSASPPTVLLSVALPSAIVVSICTACFWIAFGPSWPFAIRGAAAVLIVSDPYLTDNVRRSLLAAWSGRLSRGGLDLRRPESIPKLGKIDLVLFERTGVLTLGRYEVTKVVPLAEDRKPEDLMRMAAAAEFGVRHPFSNAIIEYQHMKSGTIPSVRGFEYIPSQGIRAFLQGRELLCGNSRLLAANGFDEEQLEQLREVARPLQKEENTVIFLTLNGEAQGLIALKDSVRLEASETLSVLREKAKRVGVVSGDDPVSVSSLSRKLGEFEIHADLSAEQRSKTVDARVKQGEGVAVVATREKNAGAMNRATVSIEWPSRGEEDSLVVHGQPAPVDVSLSKPDLRLVDDVIRAGKSYLRALRSGFGLVGLYQATALSVVSGAWYPLLGIPPSAIVAATLYLTARFLTFRVRKWSTRATSL